MKIYRRFSVSSRESLSLVIPNNKNVEFILRKMASADKDKKRTVNS